jgi:hypothetical protein
LKSWQLPFSVLGENTCGPSLAFQFTGRVPPCPLNPRVNSDYKYFPLGNLTCKEDPCGSC